MSETEATLLTLRWGPPDLSFTTANTTNTTTSTVLFFDDGDDDDDYYYLYYHSCYFLVSPVSPVLFLQLVLLFLRPACASTYDRDDHHENSVPLLADVLQTHGVWCFDPTISVGPLALQYFVCRIQP